MARRLGLTTAAILAVLAVWAFIVLAGTRSAWWRSPVAPRGDTTAFWSKIVKEVDARNRGNVVVCLLVKGDAHSVHVR